MRRQYKQKPNGSRRVSRLSGAAWLACSVTFSGVLQAQNTGVVVNYGVAPGANTQKALADPLAVDDGLLSGFYASVGVSIAKHSDINRAGADDEDSVIVITPSLAYKTHLGRHQAQIEYSTAVARHDTFDSEDYEDYRLGAALDLDLGRKLGANVFAAFTSATEARGGSSTRAIQSAERDQVEVLDYGVSLTYGPRTSRSVSVTVGADRSDWRYQNNAQEFRDRDITGVHGRLDYFLSPKTSVFVRGSHHDIDYTQQLRDLDSTEDAAEIGVSWQATAKTLGEVSAGRLEKDFDNPANADFSGLTYRGRVRWMPKRYTGVDLYGSRRTEETTTIDDSFFVSNLVGVSVDHAFTDRWFGSVYYNYIEDEFDSGRNDETDDFGAELNYAFRRWLSVGVKYGHVERSSNAAEANYEDDYLVLTLTGRTSYITGGDRGSVGRAQQ